MIVPLTPLHFGRRAALLFGQKIGIVDGDRRFTYSEFAERIFRLAHALLDYGLQPNDRVAFLAYNSYPLLEAYYGVLEAGGILLPLNFRLRPEDLVYICEDAGVRFLFAEQELAPLVDQIMTQVEKRPRLTWLTGVPDGHDGPLYDDVLDAASSTELPERSIDENSVAELFYTSGTTGQPKGVMLTHRNLYLHALSCLTVLPTTDGTAQLHTIPLFHVNGWGIPHFLTGVGGKHVMLRKFDPGEVLRLVEAERVSRFAVVPTMLTMILNHPDLHRYDLSSLEYVNTGGAPTPPDMVRRAEEALGCTIMGGYGLSETSPVLSIASDKTYLQSQPEEQRIQRRASAGLSVLGVDLRIVGPDGTELPWDGSSVGEVVVRGNGVMKGYWNAPSETEAVLHDGWFHTGDMAVVDPEGFVLVVDRKKDIIISGGENISSVEIEKVVYEHPAVLENAVIGVPDDQWGEVPKVIVALRQGEQADEEDILQFCRDRLAGFKVPKSVQFVDALPKGGTGKILKDSLRSQYWEGYGKRVH